MANIKLSRSSIRWLVLEGIAIIASILLAFWLNAWWEDQQNREEETALLRSLAAELEDLEARFARNELYVAAIRQSVRKLMEAGANSKSELTDTEIDGLLSDIFYFVAPELVEVPILDSLFLAGDQVVVSDPELRRKLSVLTIELRSVRRAIEQDFNFQGEAFGAYLDRNTYFLQIWNVMAPAPGTTDSFDDFVPLPTDIHVSHKPLLYELEFQNKLLIRDQFLKQFAQERDGTRKPLREAIEQIHGYLEQ